MKKIFTLALALALSAGCVAEENPKKDTKSVSCYSGSTVTYQHDHVVLVVAINDRDISATIKEIDTGDVRRIPISQCYFKDN